MAGEGRPVPDLPTTWVADTVPAGPLAYPPSVLPGAVPLDGPVWTLSMDLVLQRDGVPVAQVHPPGGTRWVAGAVWVDATGRVGVRLAVELPDGRRFVAEGLWRAERFGEKTQERT